MNVASTADWPTYVQQIPGEVSEMFKVLWSYIMFVINHENLVVPSGAATFENAIY
jgi:hypothetical protein